MMTKNASWHQHGGTCVVVMISLLMVGFASCTTTISRSRSSTVSESLFGPDLDCLDSKKLGSILRVDVNTGLVTITTLTSSSGPHSSSSVLASSYSATFDPAAVSGLMCYNNTNTTVLTMAMSEICKNTFGAEFQAEDVTKPLLISASSGFSWNSTTSSSSNSEWVSHDSGDTMASRFPNLRLSSIFALSCDGTAAYTSLSSSCRVCNLTAATGSVGHHISTPCESLMRVRCRAPFTVVTPPARFVPLRVATPAVYANATLAWTPSFPQSWYPQYVCSSSASSLPSSRVVVATLAIGYGAVGNASSGYVSGLDVLQYGTLQFEVSCVNNNKNNNSAAPSSSCGIVPFLYPKPNISLAIIVTCVDVTRESLPVPFNEIAPPPPQSCTYRYDSGSIIGGLVASCSSSSSSDVVVSTLPVCTSLETWNDIAVPFCQNAGFDSGAIVVVPSAAAVSTTTTVWLQCPVTFFPLLMISQNFTSCKASLLVSASPSSSSSSSSCRRDVNVQCYNVALPRPAVDWEVGTALFAAACVVTVILAVVGSWNAAKARHESFSVRRSRSRYSLSAKSVRNNSVIINNSNNNSFAATPAGGDASADFTPTITARRTPIRSPGQSPHAGYARGSPTSMQPMVL